MDEFDSDSAIKFNLAGGMRVGMKALSKRSVCNGLVLCTKNKLRGK
jgi:hypothetical protein